MNGSSWVLLFLVVLNVATLVFNIVMRRKEKAYIAQIHEDRFILREQNNHLRAELFRLKTIHDNAQKNR